MPVGNEGGGTAAEHGAHNRTTSVVIVTFASHDDALRQCLSRNGDGPTIIGIVARQAFT